MWRVSCALLRKMRITASSDSTARLSPNQFASRNAKAWMGTYFPRFYDRTGRSVEVIGREWRPPVRPREWGLPGRAVRSVASGFRASFQCWLGYYRRMKKFRAFGWIVAASFALGSCAAMAPSATWPIDWQVSHNEDQTLVGRIWSPQSQSWVTPAQLRAAVGDARFVIIGETHDNPDHHRVQAQLLRAVVDVGRRPTVGFEMLDMAQQPALDTFLQGHPTDALALGPAVNWAATGWPAWSMYAPIATVALAHRLPIAAANLPAETIKNVVMKGYGALEPGQVAELGLDKPMPAAQSEGMREELYQSHCELLPKADLTGMIDGQRTRNAIMAWRMVNTAGVDGAVLITGSGHARMDYGVPLNLREDAADSSVLSVALIEVDPAKHKPADYAELFMVTRLPFDYVLFTPAAERTDPCVALRKRFGK